MERILITGIGAVSALGLGAERLFAAALSGESGVALLPGQPEPRVAAAIGDGIGQQAMAGMPANVDRHVGLAKLAALEAMGDAGLDGLAPEEGHRFGIYWGTGVGSAATVEESYGRIHAGQRPRPLTILLGMQNAAVAQLALDFGLRGPQLSISQACASGAAAIGEALLALRHGRADRILVGGSDAPLVPGQLAAWDALRVLARPDPEAPARSCRPFDRRRSGLVLGEGAAALVLERESVARRRRARVYGELCGYGNAGDASHYASPDPAGQERAMALALADGGLEPGQVGYINAHATGTRIGDQSECEAIRRLFGRDGQPPAVSSTKGIHGHTLGAAGALELAITVQAVKAGLLPASAHLEESEMEGVDLIVGGPRRHPVRAALSNTFAFGGSNVCLAVRSYPSEE